MPALGVDATDVFLVKVGIGCVLGGVCLLQLTLAKRGSILMRPLWCVLACLQEKRLSVTHKAFVSAVWALAVMVGVDVHATRCRP